MQRISQYNELRQFPDLYALADASRLNDVQLVQNVPPAKAVLEVRNRDFSTPSRKRGGWGEAARNVDAVVTGC